MAVTTLKLAGKEFVILPKKEYAAMKMRLSPRSRGSRKLSKEDIEDAAEIERIRRDPAEKPIPWEEFWKRSK